MYNLYLDYIILFFKKTDFFKRSFTLIAKIEWKVQYSHIPRFLLIHIDCINLYSYSFIGIFQFKHHWMLFP